MIETNYNPIGDIANNLFLYGGYFVALVVLAGAGYITYKLLKQIYNTTNKF